MFALKRSLSGFKISWLFLVALALIFGLLYLGFSLFPGRIDPSISKYFSITLAEKARTYTFPYRVIYIVRFFAEVFLLLWLLFSSQGQKLYDFVRRIGRHYWLTSVLAILGIWLLAKLLSLPFDYYTGFYWQKVWGFSTQSQAAWWWDYGKNAGIDLFLSLLGGLAFFGLVNRLPRYWWLAGALLFSVWLVVEYLLWPVLIAPLFNKFELITNPGIINMVNSLAQRAGLHINGMFVMDASRQTTLANAYFTGLGSTKRIVIYDTLLHNYSLPEIQAVIAHEMGHWQHNDVIHGLIYGMLGSFITFRLLAFFLKYWLPQNRQKPPELWAALQLVLLLILFVSSPLQNFISREMELRADAFSLEITRNLPAEIQLQKDLAISSLSDLSPPGFIVWFSYDHPPAVARIQALEREYAQITTDTKK